MNVLLIDDHQLYRLGLKAMLTGLLGVDNVFFLEASDCNDALEFRDRTDIDLILLDLNLPDTSGIDALEKIKQHFSCRIVVVSGEDKSGTIRDMLDHGAVGYIPKSTAPEVMEPALKLVLAEGKYLPPHLLDGETRERQLNDSKALQRDAVLRELTKRQLDVLAMAVQGKPNKVIARELHIAEGTVKAHLSACYRVLEVDNRTKAGFAAASLGLLPEQ